MRGSLRASAKWDISLTRACARAAVDINARVLNKGRAFMTLSGNRSCKSARDFDLRELCYAVLVYMLKERMRRGVSLSDAKYRMSCVGFVLLAKRLQSAV